MDKITFIVTRKTWTIFFYFSELVESSHLNLAFFDLESNKNMIKKLRDSLKTELRGSRVLETYVDSNLNTVYQLFIISEILVASKSKHQSWRDGLAKTLLPD